MTAASEPPDNIISCIAKSAKPYIPIFLTSKVMSFAGLNTVQKKQIDNIKTPYVLIELNLIEKYTVDFNDQYQPLHLHELLSAPNKQNT